ncbi:hypothetical protein D3C86_1585650 [compost metagenome]
MGGVEQIQVGGLGGLGDRPVLVGMEDRHLAKPALQVRIRKSLVLHPLGIDPGDDLDPFAGQVI